MSVDTATAASGAAGGPARRAARSKVVSRNVGLGTRLAALMGDQATADDGSLWAEAGHRLDAAAASSDLITTGERSCGDMLARIGKSLGYDVRVIFADARAA